LQRIKYKSVKLLLYTVYRTRNRKVRNRKVRKEMIGIRDEF